MKIVFITAALPHPFGDTTGRWYFAFLKELTARGHSVVAIAATEESEARISETTAWLAVCGRNLLFKPHRLQVDCFTLRRRWRNAIRPGSELLQDGSLVRLVEDELAQGYDVLHLEHLASGWLGVGRERALLNILYFDAIDWAAKSTRTWGDRKTLWQARRCTRRLLGEFKAVRVLTPRLKEMAERILRKRRCYVVPLALDTSLYDLQPFVEEPVLGMIGSFHWDPTRSAAERLITRIWPRVKKRIPSSQLVLAGWNAEKYLQRYRAVADVKVSQDLSHPSEFFARVGVMVYAPLRGSGMKVKVMESMAYGVPVVTTWEGVEGIEYENGFHCCVEETDQAIAERACQLLSDRNWRLRMRAAARKLMEERYSPKPVVDQMLRVYRQLISKECSASCQTEAVSL
jgi:polysaccharide biosynthesis protein PslH